MDSCFRRNDIMGETAAVRLAQWIPAFAGMTSCEGTLPLSGCHNGFLLSEE
ncbi:Uncharacterized protein dnm_068590 [Desulfonema magnum]|uniref:Uncharacterized protein n=1 Tax=Desulfonema magnum TaxID=45655 RepID=A0A975BSX9_9BACT|nr:Uncharacterized protein dnm_068590 [Desulfonema magnum]